MEKISENKVFTHREPWNRHVIDFLFMQGENVGTNIILEKPVEGRMLEPTFRLSNENAQSLFNELWALGFRPQDGTGNSGHVEAMKYHLEDMRRIVFGEKKL